MTADRDYYRLCLHEATGGKEAAAPASSEEEQQLLAQQRGPFTEHLRPYLREISELTRRVQELEQQAHQAAQQAAAAQGRRRSSATAFLLSSLLAEGAAEAAAAGGGGGPPSLLQLIAEGPLAQQSPQQQQQQQSQAAQYVETELEKDVRLATEAEAWVFLRAHQEMRVGVADLTRGIELKEKLAGQLQESIKRYEVMRRVYEERLREMEEETARYVCVLGDEEGYGWDGGG